VPALVASVLLGLGLAASCGLRAFLPLLMMGLAARFHLGGVTLNEHLAWVSSTPSLIALGCAAAAELAADKVPFVDHALHLIGTVTHPAAAAFAAAAAFQHADPTTMAIAGLILGVPTALAVHTAQAETRLASTATTAGLANPFISAIEDVITFGTAAAALLAPVIIPMVLLILVLALWAVFRARSPKSSDRD
jgi:hypothetical protein